MPQIKRYIHRDGFNGSCKDALYVEVVCAEVAIVYPDGRRVICEHIDLADVDSWVEMGWWIEQPAPRVSWQEPSFTYDDFMAERLAHERH